MIRPGDTTPADGGVAGVDDLAPISRESTAAIIADRLRSAIMRGTLRPNSQLGELNLAAKFGVSRGPLREAMQRLLQEGLLVSEPHRGLFVVQFGEDDVTDIYCARTAIESTAARRILSLGAGKESADELDRVVESMDDAASSEDFEALSEADYAFHELLVLLAHSPRLTRMNRTLLVETHMCMRELQNRYSDPHSLVDEHRAIVDALRRGDRAAMLSQIELHMDDAINRLTGKATGQRSTGPNSQSHLLVEKESHGRRSAGTRSHAPR